MRVAFVGLPLAALLLRHDGHEIVWAGICRKDAIGSRRLARSLGKRMKIVPRLEDEIENVRALAPDLVVSWFWTKKIPREFLSVASFGAIGVHPSLLPRHRGPDPYFWAIDSGDEATGVTAHLLEEDYDTGAIVGQEKLRIDPSWNAWTLAKRLDRPSLALLRATAIAFASGTPPLATPQNDKLATKAPEPDDDLLEIRWSDSAEKIARRVRAASPHPGAFTAIGEETVTLLEVRSTTDFPRALAPGEAAVRADGIAIVRTSDAAVELHRGRIDDDDAELDSEDLAAILAEPF